MNDHREQRERLGPFVLGHGSPAERLAVQAHLDGCAECRAEVAHLAPVVGALDLVDLDHLDDAASPPPGLGDAIFARIDAERSTSARRRAHHAGRRRGRVAMVAAAVSCAAALVVGFALAWQIKPAPPDVPREAVAVRSLDTGIDVAEADLVPHTWGVEIQIEAEGFTEGATYRAAVIDVEGRPRPAGEFIGIGGEAMRCNLNSSVLRDDATGFEITDETGSVVVTSSF